MNGTATLVAALLVSSGAMAGESSILARLANPSISHAEPKLQLIAQRQRQQTCRPRGAVCIYAQDCCSFSCPLNFTGTGYRWCQ
jgi:hypothetical protein